MAKPVEIRDHLDYPWLIYPEDPAHQHVKTLQNLGLKLVILPRSTILTGTLVEPKAPNLFAFVGDLTPDIRDIIIRLVRLYDCTRYLWDMEQSNVDGDSELPAG